MAEAKVNIWEAGHGEEGDRMVSQVYPELLMTNVAYLSKTLQFTDKFWQLMGQREVLDEKTAAKIKDMADPNSQILALLMELMNVKVYKFHGFLWALVNTNQQAVVERLGFSADQYIDIQSFLGSSSLKCPTCAEPYINAYILTSCGHRICRPCVKGAQFITREDKKEIIYCPVPGCKQPTEANPTDETLGLQEDLPLAKLCQAVEGKLKEATAPDAGVNTTEESLEKLLKQLGAKIEKLNEDEQASAQSNATVVERQSEFTDFVQEEGKKMKTMVDEWVKKNIATYKANTQQVMEKSNESRHRREVLSEVSLLVQAKPILVQLAPDIEAYVNIESAPIPPKVHTYVAQAGLGAHPEALLSPPPDFSQMSQDYGRMAMTGKHMFKWEKPGQEATVFPKEWTQDGEILVYERTASKLCNVWKLVPHTQSKTCSQLVVKEVHDGLFAMAADGATAIAENISNSWRIFISLPDKSDTSLSLPKGESLASFDIDNDNVYVILRNENTLNCYDRKTLKGRQYNLGSHNSPTYVFIHSNNQGKVMVSSTTTHRIYVVDLTSGVTVSFGGLGRKDGELNEPKGMCTVNNGQHILVCDTNNHRISMFTLGGGFIRHLSVEGDLRTPEYISVFCRPPPHASLLALTTRREYIRSTSMYASNLNFYSVDTSAVKAN